ncbi:hypothetical protein JOD20_002392 [Herpetosiphon giganteus]|nr:hypothetical protein [Herpetosiphon giganteus]
MGRKSRRKRERRALQQELPGIEEVRPFDWVLMEALLKRKDDPTLFAGSFDTPVDTSPLTEADITKTFEHFTSRL